MLGDANPRFIVTSLGPAEALCPAYCARETLEENGIKEAQGEALRRPHVGDDVGGKPTAPVIRLDGLRSARAPKARIPRAHLLFAIASGKRISPSPTPGYATPPPQRGLYPVATQRPPRAGLTAHPANPRSDVLLRRAAIPNPRVEAAGKVDADAAPYATDSHVTTGQGPWRVECHALSTGTRGVSLCKSAVPSWLRPRYPAHREGPLTTLSSSCLLPRFARRGLTQEQKSVIRTTNKVIIIGRY